VVEGECRGLKDDVNYGHIDNGYLECHRKNYGPDKVKVWDESKSVLSLRLIKTLHFFTGL